MTAAAHVAYPDAPFVGLSYYTEDRADVFFGRDAERTVIIGNLRAARLTLLYAQSGVGKSSLLRAGVASRLRGLAYRSLGERGHAGYIPVVFSSWRDEPLEQLIDAVERAMTPFVVGKPPVLPRGSLHEALAAAASLTNSVLLVILDQFEEYLLYSSHDAQSAHFACELARAIGRHELAANFLIAIREDSYAGLGDLFEGRVANLYGNYLRLDYLNRVSAQAAIVKPIEQFNAVRADGPPIEVEPALIDEVLDQVRRGRVAFEQRHGTITGNGLADDKVETPYLQLVMMAVWERERSIGSNVLRSSTLEALGNAEEIVRSHLDIAMSGLLDDERATAADVFNHLVTPSGSKIAHAITDLAGYAGRTPAELDSLVEKLATGDRRILRRVAPAPGDSSGGRVEIFHDVLAPAILGWRSAQTTARLQEEKRQAQKDATRERRRARLFIALAALATALLVAAIVLGVLAQAESHRANHEHLTALSSQLGAQALSDLGGGTLGSGALGRGILLGLEAYRYGHPIDARTSIVRALEVTADMRTYVAVHTAAVPDVAFSRDGTLLASASADATVVIQDAASGLVLRTLRGSSAEVQTVAFSPDNRSLASGSADGTVAVWDAKTGRRLLRLGAGGTVPGIISVAYSPDGRSIAAADANGMISIWDAIAGHELMRLGGLTAPANSVAFSPDGHAIAAGGGDGRVIVWDASTGRRRVTLQGQIAPINAIAFSPRGRTLASASDDQTIVVWDYIAGRRLRELRGQAAPIRTVAYSPDGRTLSGHSGSSTSVAFSPSGTTLASANGDQTVTLWNAETGRMVGTLVGHRNAVESVAFSHTRRTLVSAGADNSVIVWDLATRRPRIRLVGPTDLVYSVAVSPDGRVIAGGSADQTVTLWDAATGRVLRRLIGHTSFVYGVAFSPDGRTRASASADQSVILWKVATGRRLATLRGHTGPVESVAFSPDGRLLASASDDGTVILWDAKTGGQLGDPLRGHGGHVLTVAFSPDSRRLVSGSADGSVIMWELASRLGEPLATHEGTVSGVVFSPGGATVASSSLDGTVSLLRAPSDVDLHEIWRQLCSIVRRNLTTSEWHEFVPNEPYHPTCSA